MNKNNFKIIGIALLIFSIISLFSGCSNNLFDNTKPEITVTGVEDGEIYNTDITPQISADEEVTWDITLTKDGNDINYSRGDTINEEGEYVLTIKATDKAGNEQIFGALTFEFSNDTTAPSVNITSPSDGDLLGENNITVQWTITDESPYNWELYIGGSSTPNAVGDQNSFLTYTFDPVDIFENYYGGVRIRVEAADEVDNNGSDYVDITIDTRPDITFKNYGNGYWYDIDSDGLIINIVNNGPSTADESTVEVYFSNDDRTEYISVPSLESGESTELKGIQLPSVGGGDNIYFDVILDVNDDVQESDETNNEDDGFLVT